MKPLLVTVAAPSREIAGTIARAAVEAKLAACAQVSGPLSSVYRWKGKVETAEEWRIDFKTEAGVFDDLCKLVKDLHPYEVPEVLAFPVGGGYRPYLDWMEKETGRD